MKLWVSVVIGLLIALFFYFLPRPEPEVSASTDAANSFVLGPGLARVSCNLSRIVNSDTQAANCKPY